MSDQNSSFFIGQSFAAYSELEEFIKFYETTKYEQLYKRTSEKSKCEKLRYSRLVLCCKAGGRAYVSTSKGKRKTRSFKTDCPFKIIINEDEIKQRLVVTNAELGHNCLIAGHPEVFKHLPRQRRPDEAELKMILDVKACLGKTKGITALINSKCDKIITSKDIENVVAQYKKNNVAQTDLESLLSKMRAHTGNTIFVTHTNQVIDTIFFQDSYMKNMYQNYPEILLVDATYKMNQNRMCLLVLMVIDGNGESGVVGLALMRSESESCTVAALSNFKQAVGASYENTETIMADKDMGNRAAFSQVFPHSKVHICIFHVLQTFIREVTCSKRSITFEQKEKALSCLKKMVYADTEEKFMSLYSQLAEIGAQDVTNYFNKNWFEIREQWAMYGQNSMFHIMSRTNNRLERFNRDLNEITIKYQQINLSFENIMKAVIAARIERDKRAVDMMCKRKLQVDDYPIAEYSGFLTDFAYKKVLNQYEVSSKLRMNIPPTEPSIFVSRERTYNFSLSECECSFFTIMRLPCRHIFALACVMNREIFLPDLCAKRWLMSDFRKVKENLLRTERLDSRLLTSSPSEPPKQSLNKFQKFRELKQCALDLAEIVSQQPEHIYNECLSRFKVFKSEIISQLITESFDAAVDESQSETNSVPLNVTSDEPQHEPQTDEGSMSNNSYQQNEPQNEAKIINDTMGSKFACFCGFKDASSIDTFMCCHCQLFYHATCHGILNCYRMYYDFRSDPDASLSCYKCPDQKYSDPSLKKMSRSELKAVALKRLAIKNIITNGSLDAIPGVKNAEASIDLHKVEEMIHKNFLRIDQINDLSCSGLYESGESEIHIDDPLLETRIELVQTPTLPVMMEHAYTMSTDSLKLPPVPVNNPKQIAKKRKAQNVTLKYYNQLSTIQKRKKLLNWLIGSDNINNISLEQELLSCDDVKRIDKLTLQKFRNKEIDTSIMESFFETTAFTLFNKMVLGLKSWLCFTCKTSTSKTGCVLCDICLNWYHIRCVGLRSAPKKQFYACPDCAN